MADNKGPALQQTVWRMGIGDLAPMPNADKLTAGMIENLTNGRLADAISFDYYQRLRFIAGTAIPTTPLRMFGVPNGGQFATFNTGANYQQNDDDTNLDIAGQLQKSYEYWQKGIWCRVSLPGNTPTTSSVGMPLNPVPLATAPAASLINAVLERGVITNKIASKDYEKGNLYQFPCPYGVSGQVGAGSGTDFEAIFQNGRVGVLREFDVWHQIEGGDAFGPVIQFFGSLLPPVDFTVTVGFSGILFRSVQ